MPTALDKEWQELVLRCQNQYEINQKSELFKIDKNHDRRKVATCKEKDHLLRELHDGPLGGHQGQQSTFEKIAKLTFGLTCERTSKITFELATSVKNAPDSEKEFRYNPFLENLIRSST